MHINKFIFVFSLTCFFFNLSFAQWIRTEVPNDFLISDMEIYNNELYAIMGYKVIKFQKDELSFEILTLNHEFQYSLASNKDFIFAGNYSLIRPSDLYGVLRSEKGDTTWIRFENQLPRSSIFSLSAKDNLIAAGGAFGVYASWDNGINWTRTLRHLGIGYFDTPIFLSDEVILVGGENLVNISFDAMQTWSNSRVTGQVRGFLEKENIYYLITTHNAYRSINKGVSWELLNDGLQGSIGFTNIIDYTKDSIMVATGGKLFTLKNGENYWNLYDNPEFGIAKMIVYNNTIWAGGRNGIWKKKIISTETNTHLLIIPTLSQWGLLILGLLILNLGAFSIHIMDLDKSQNGY